MLKTLNFKHIFYFWVVAREQSVTKAATILNVSQSSISEQIRVLEDRVTVELFDRSQRRMHLSTTGKVVFKTLDEFFPRIEELFESLKNHKSHDVKFLRIGICPAISSRLRFQLCFPFIEDMKYTVKILQGENEFLLDAFNKDEIDLFFTTNTKTKTHGNSEKEIMTRKRFCIVSNKNVHDSFIAKDGFKNLNSVPFINYTPDSDLHFKITKVFHSHKFSPMRIAEIDDIELTKETIYHLDSFAILPYNSVSHEVETGMLYDLEIPLTELENDITAIYKTKFKTDRFTEHLRNISKELRLTSSRSRV